jgi:hypothetical protein
MNPRLILLYVTAAYLGVVAYASAADLLPPVLNRGTYTEQCRARSAVTGRIVTLAYAKSHPTTTVVECNPWRRKIRAS